MMKKKNLDDILIVKISKKEKNKAKTRAKIHFNGDLSKFVRYCIENYIAPKPKPPHP